MKYSVYFCKSLTVILKGIWCSFSVVSKFLKCSCATLTNHTSPKWPPDFQTSVWRIQNVPVTVCKSDLKPINFDLSRSIITKTGFHLL